MTPSCPNCGTIYHVARSPSSQWHGQCVSIESFWVDERAYAPRETAFVGHEYRCNKCRHRWRAAAVLDVNSR